MKLKKILVLSLAINAVLLSAMGYIATQSWEPRPQPPLLRFITNAVPETVEVPVPGETTATVAN
jgi:hypothetical protein